MSHKEFHPDPVEDCFGCKVSTIGYDGGHTTQTKRDELGNDTTEHRTGRVDVNIRAATVHVKSAANKE